MIPSLTSLSLDLSIKAQGNFLSAILPAESLTDSSTKSYYLFVQTLAFVLSDLPTNSALSCHLE